MDGLSSADLQGALTFIEDAWAAAGEHPFPLETLQGLARLIPCDVIAYAEMDRVARRELDYVGNGPDADNGRFWEIVDEHPLCRHQLAYSDFAATRLSDVISHRRLVNSRIYAGSAPRGSRRSSRSASTDHAYVRATSCSSGAAATSRTVTGRCSRSSARTWRGSTR